MRDVLIILKLDLVTMMIGQPLEAHPRRRYINDFYSKWSEETASSWWQWWLANPQLYLIHCCKTSNNSNSICTVMLSKCPQAVLLKASHTSSQVIWPLGAKVIYISPLWVSFQSLADHHCHQLEFGYDEDISHYWTHYLSLSELIRRYINDFHTKRSNDLGRSVGSFEKYCLRTLWEHDCANTIIIIQSFTAMNEVQLRIEKCYSMILDMTTEGYV